MSSLTTLCFVRHAAAETIKDGSSVLCGQYDAPLSPLGDRQVISLRQRLAREGPFDALYSSHLRRALETAEAAPEPILQSLCIQNDLAEINCGELDGQRIVDIQRQRPDLWQRNEAQTDDDFSWPGGESYRCFRTRVLAAIEHIVKTHSGQTVLVVTHAGVISQLFGSLAGQSAARWEDFRPRHASFTRVLWTPRGAHVDIFDDCGHL
jgi:broad specificity phosphatase PhoE